MKKLSFIIIPIILIGGFLLLKGTSKADAIAPVPTAQVEQVDIESTIYVNGTVKTEEVRTIIPRDTTILKTLKVKEGDVVKKGDVIAEMDKTSLQQQLDSKLIQLDIEKVKLSNMEKGSDLTLTNSMRQAKIALDEAKANFENDQSLFDAGVISKQKYQSSLNVYENAKATYSNAQYSLQNSTRESDQYIQIKSIESMENDIKILEDKIADASVKSPIDGVVTEIKGVEGQAITSSLMTISNFDKNIIEANISEADINKIKLGQEVTITANAAKGQTFTGKVTFISPGSKNVEGKKQAFVGIKVILDEKSEALRTNFSVKMKITTAFKAEAKAVRFEAVKSRLNGEEYVTVQKPDGTTEDITIQAGISNELYIEVITNQLNVGDVILIETPNAIEEDLGIF